MSAQPSLALVTGAASGIGAEVSRRLAGRGHTVITVDRTLELSEAAAQATGPNAIAAPCDLSDPTSVAALCERISGEWASNLDVVVCNAGIIKPGDVADLAPLVMDLHLSIMLNAPMHMIQAALPSMIERKTGHVLATVSMGGIVPMPGSAPYSAAKCGMRAFLSSVNAEVRGHGVKVSGIYPNAVDTPMLREEAASGGSALNFVGAVKTIDDVADAYDRALDTGKLEFYVPYSDGISGRLVSMKMAAIPKLTPLLNKLGERGRVKYLASEEPRW